MASSSFPILFVAPERVDDAIFASGLIRRLVDEVPHARFTVVAGEAVAPLFRDTPGLERTILFEPTRSALRWLGLWRRVRGRRWGLVLDLRGSKVARFLHARRRGVARPHNPALEPVHKVIEAAQVLRIDDEAPAPFLFVGEETRAKADKLLAGSLLGGSGPILAVAPSADWVGKTWPAERFAIVVAELMGPKGPLHDGRLLLLGGPDDRWATETVRRVTPRGRLIDLLGKSDLLTLYACLQKARLFIGNEGPYLHLAAAAGAPSLGLFGPSNDRLLGPWGAHTRVVRGPRTYEQLRALDPTRSLAVNHMQDLAATKVAAAARALLDETAARVQEEA